MLTTNEANKARRDITQLLDAALDAADVEALKAANLRAAEYVVRSWVPYTYGLLKEYGIRGLHICNVFEPCMCAAYDCQCPVCDNSRKDGGLIG
jgi:hypothetical protein